MSNHYYDRLLAIPHHLRIKILHSDNSIIVIHKPSLLRSVPVFKKIPEEDNIITATTTHHNFADNHKKRPRSTEEQPNESVKFSPSLHRTSSDFKLSNENTNNVPSTKVETEKSMKQTVQESFVKAIEYYSSQNQDFIQQEIAKAATNVEECATSKNYLEGNEYVAHLAQYLLTNLSSKRCGDSSTDKNNLSNIPRKLPTFQRYVNRNVKTLLPHLSKDTKSIHVKELGNASVIGENMKSTKKKRGVNKEVKGQKRVDVDIASKIVHDVLSNQCQKILDSLMANEGQMMKDEYSAYGQIALLIHHYQEVNKGGDKNRTMNEQHDHHHNSNRGTSSIDYRKRNVQELYGDLKHYKINESRRDIFVVHRLDCETSGLLLFARDHHSASKLSSAWRGLGKSQVQKTYLAKVKHWNPYHEQKQKDGLIDLPMAPMGNDTVMWRVVKVDSCSQNISNSTEVEKNRFVQRAKPSQTKWRVLYERKADTIRYSCDDDNSSSSYLLLELQPRTGTTHQLRVHCAAMGSGIEGDSLYGESPIIWNERSTSSSTSNCNNTSEEREIESQSMSLRLHAYTLSVPHPITDLDIEFKSDKIPWILAEDKKILC